MRRTARLDRSDTKFLRTILAAIPSPPSQFSYSLRRLRISLPDWGRVSSSLLKNRYSTTYRCYSIPETSSQDEFSAAIRSSNRHVGEECDLGDVRHRLVGWTSTSALSATPLPLRSLSLRDVAAPRRVLFSARLTRLRALATCMIHRYADRIRPAEQRSITTPMSCDDVSGSP